MGVAVVRLQHDSRVALAVNDVCRLVAVAVEVDAPACLWLWHCVASVCVCVCVLVGGWVGGCWWVGVTAGARVQRLRAGTERCLQSTRYSVRSRMS